MLQLKNSTPFAADIALFPNEQGIDSLYIIVKATFNIGNKWTLVEDQPPPETEDVYFGEPAESSLKFASDYHTGKPATDIIMLGEAYAPNNKSVTQMDVSLSVDKVCKTVRIIGDRVWRNGRVTSPAPFVSMPLIYEKAFGGQHVADGDVLSNEEKNPVGTGFSGARTEADMDGLPLPNLENPSQLITGLDDKPEPACFGFVSAGWKPRVDFVGTYDEHWKKNRAPYLPENFDNRFFNMAHQDLIYPCFLTGGEKVQITNMHPKGNLQFSIPVVKLFSEVSINGRKEQVHFNMETLLLQPNQMQLSMTYKSSLSCNLEMQKIKEISIKLAT